QLVLMSIGLGGICAALTLVKINIGVFATLALALAASTVLERGWLRMVARVAAPATAIALPWVLMRSQLAAGWGAAHEYYTYSLLVSLSLVPVVLIAFRQRETLIGPRHCLAFVITFGTALVAICAFVFFRGTSIQGLFASTVVLPLRLPQVYTRAASMQSGVVCAFFSTLLAGTYLLARRTIGGGAASVGHLIALMKFALGAGVVIFSAFFPW